ncbi:MAG: quinone-dependent dihydroorotate dehydrogenase [Burkholderiaceae bacterium]|nr:quinone-dependent dihydroorotate dehydrogenase [Burkholderiaceae bacterium]
MGAASRSSGHLVLYELARPLLFSLDPEAAHELTLATLQRTWGLSLARWFAPRVDPLPVHVMGLSFSNPVGLAAGLDKTGAHVDALGRLGFGFIEAGTVTPRPQPGNPKPRMFRLVAARAIINRMGFNNPGVDRFASNVRQQQSFRERGGIVGLNIGKNADTPIDNALDDYRTCLRRVYADADYVSINVSSPNTKDLRSLQSARQLAALLAGLTDERKRLEDQHSRRVPLAVKIAPDLPDESVPEVADALVEHGIDAVIATNTTVAREMLGDQKYAKEAGGLSGAPLTVRSTEIIHALSNHLKGALPIIGVGGIMSASDALEKIEAGAALVQLYTGLIYSGPKLIGDCVNAIRHSRCAAFSPPGPTQQRV